MDTTGDLRRLLAYDDAMALDEHGAATEELGPELAADIVTLPFWSPAMCRTVIDAAEAIGAWAPHPDDPVPGNEVSLSTISPRLFAHVEDRVYEFVWPLLQQQWPSIDFAGLVDAFVIRYDAVERPELPLHHDVAQISLSVKLNDDYSGGALEFPRQGVSNAAVPVGWATVWPSLVTHPHRGAPVTDGVKYGLTIWCRVPGTADQPA